jgi:Zn-dependent protease
LDPSYLKFVIVFAPVLLFSLTFHEAAHAWMSNRLGDPTARLMGRLSLNPVVHLDIFGTLMLFLSQFRFGWAKPVPFDPRNFRDVKRGIFLTAAAGPASNVLLAIGCGLIVRSMLASGWGVQFNDGFMAGLGRVFAQGVITNLALAFFNLIPLPPLDGSKILYGLAPSAWENALLRMDRFGPMALMLLIMVGFVAGFSPIWAIIGPFVSVFTHVFSGVPLGVLYGLIYS